MFGTVPLGGALGQVAALSLATIFSTRLMLLAVQFVGSKDRPGAAPSDFTCVLVTVS